MSASYKLASDSWDQTEFDAIKRVLSSGQLTLGPEVDIFEDEFSEFLNVKHSIMVNSGSSANLLGVAALVFSGSAAPGSVVVPAVSWSTTYYPWTQYGFKLKFVDIDPDTLNFNMNQLEKAITPDVTAVCGVNLLGNPSCIDEVAELCSSCEIPLLEDNCESFGASVNGKLAGSFGTIGTHSFFFSHHLQTIEGGMLSTDNDQLAALARSLRAHGWSRDKKSGNLSRVDAGDFGSSFEFLYPGYCLRPTEIAGAVGRAQLRKAAQHQKVRLSNAESFKKLMVDFGDIIRVQTDGGRQKVESSWFGFSLICHGAAKNHRNLLKSILDDFKIESRPIVAGNFTRQPVMQFLEHEIFGSLDEADSVHTEGLFVGNDGRCLTEELNLLSKAIEKFARKVRQ